MATSSCMATAKKSAKASAAVGAPVVGGTGAAAVVVGAAVVGGAVVGAAVVAGIVVVLVAVAAVVMVPVVPKGIVVSAEESPQAATANTKTLTTARRRIDISRGSTGSVCALRRRCFQSRPAQDTATARDEGFDRCS